MLALGVGKAGCRPENSLDVGHCFVVVRRRPVDDDRVHLPPENVGFVEAVLGVQLRSGLGRQENRDVPAADRRCVLGKLLHSRAEDLIENKKGARATLALSDVVGIDHVVDQAIPDELDKGPRVNRSRSGQQRYRLAGWSPEVMMSLPVKSEPVKQRTVSLVRMLLMRAVMVLEQSCRNLLSKSACSYEI